MDSVTTIKHHPGTAIKAIGDNDFEGYLCVWGDANTKDLQGEYFTPDTDFHLDWFPQRPFVYHHGLDGLLEKAAVGVITKLSKDDIGLKASGRYITDDDMAQWEEEQRELRRKYVRAVRNLIKSGDLSYSSGSLAHLTNIEDDGEIKSWVIVEASGTPAPAEPRNTDILALKSSYDELGLDASKLGLSSEDDTHKRKEDTTPKDAHSGSNADNNTSTESQIEVNTMSNETNVAVKMELDDDMKSFVRSIVNEVMAQGKMSMTEDDEVKMTAAAEDEMAKMAGESDDNNKMYDDEESTKRIALAVLNVYEQRQQARSNGVKAALAERMKASTGESTIPASTRVSKEEAATKSAPAQIQVRSRFANWQPEDFSFAATLMGTDRGLQSIKRIGEDPKFWREAADATIKAYNAGKVILSPAAAKSWAAIKDDEVMYSTLSGFGDENVPTVWADNIWSKPRLDNVVPNIFQTIEMPSNPYEYPVEAADPTVFFVPETADQASLSLDASSPAIPDTQIATRKVTFNAKKLGMNILISAELEEDGLTRLIPQYRAQAERAVLDAQDFVVLLGDTATTANINSDGETITATTRKYQAFNGLVKQALVTSTAQAVDAGGAAPTVAHIRTLRAKLSNDIGPNPTNLALVMDGSTYIKFLNDDAVLTRDKYGDAATVLTGELGRIDGIPVFVSAQMALADADGKVTNSGNTVNRGRCVLVHRNSWYIGYRRRLAQHIQFMPHFDVHVLSMTVREDFVGRTYSNATPQASDDTAAILYNIGV